ncbi:uncharacterized protein LOC119431349 isoform X3 [Dermacentor silvarum]|uniref:uncharacterized protein LOC119431349 isoform X3 n=1 Tax=Dermacentor silvarum TaxID=543639 RepID=UPI0021019521|nr:uncharacterized protein LOC119431349 isoform X3 [Dermacentor silvarum]
MATLTAAKFAGAALLFAGLAVGQDGDGKSHCDTQSITACYWSVADQHGTFPLAQEVVHSSENYLGDLCKSYPDGFPADNHCKKQSNSSCTDAEKKKFTRMERGYAVLREEITSANCQSVAQLRGCIDLGTVRNCDAKPYIENKTFEAQLETQKRAALNVKACLEEAVKSCDAKENAVAIAHLQKIADAILDLSLLSDERNAAHTTKAAAAVVVVSLLSWVLATSISTSPE